MPRPKKERRSEGPRWTRKGWVARVFEQDGACSGWLPLGTTDREHAKRLLEAWVRSGVQPARSRGEKSFAEESERVLGDKAAAPMATPAEKKAVQYRRERLRKYALPVLGQVPVGLLEPSHIMGLLDRMASEGAAARTIHNLRSDVSVILAKLVREGELKMNPARGAALPEDAPVDTRDRMHLSDEQMVAFQERRGFATPLDINVMLCRCVGGHRTSDGHAGDWSHVDREWFAWMKVRRPKTDGQVGQRVGQRKAKTKSYEYAVHAVPAEYRPVLRAYWESLGSPESGPIFPLLRDAVSTPMKLKDGRVIERQGGKVGERKGRGTSYARALRRAVWGARLYAPLGGFDPEHPEKRLCAFQTDTPTTRRLTFHGIRADLNAALVEAGVSADQRIALMGHTQETTGNKHYMKRIVVGVPDAALPKTKGAAEPHQPGPASSAPAAPAAAPADLRIPPETAPAWGETRIHPGAGGKPGPSVSGETANSSESLARPARFERATFGSVEPRSAAQCAEASVNSTSVLDGTSAAEGVSTQALGGNESLRSAFLRRMLAEAAAEGDLDLLEELTAMARRRSPALPANVHKLDVTRKRRR